MNVSSALRTVGTTFGTLLLTIAGIIGGLWLLFSASTVGTWESPNKQHEAVLKRLQGIDVNFLVFVDGTQVFRSPDFAPVRKDFCERLIWDRHGNVVLFEVAGERIFAYDAKEKRPLSASEVMSTELTPFSEFGYEGTLPRDLAIQNSSSAATSR